MMGILILLCGVAGLGASGLLGTLGFALQKRALATGDGSWLGFWLVTAVVAAAMIGIGVAFLLRNQGTPPRPDDFANVMKALFLLGAAPGAGMLAGGLVTLIR